MKKTQSEQARRDEKRAAVIQNENSSIREREKAYSELFNEHNKQLNVFFLQRTRNENAAEELLMETFAKSYKSFNKFDSGKGAFSTWLYKIATNSLIDHSRKVTMEVFSLEAMIGKHTEDSEGMEYQIASNDMNPQEKISNTALGQEIYDAIHSLPDRLVKDVMIERYINELSFKEIEDKMGFDRDCSTLRVSARRGKKILANKLSHLEQFSR